MLRRLDISYLGRPGLLCFIFAACSPDERAAERSPAPAICAVPEGAPSRAPLRRLTRFEYGRTVAELTGVPGDVASSLPPDEESLGFLNNADAYSVSTLHAAKYLELAERIAGPFVVDSARVAEFAECDAGSEPVCVDRFISAFGRRAFRRPLSEAERTAMKALYTATAGSGQQQGLSAVVAAMLQSPQFLYRPEPSSGERLDTFALATRLSFLLVAASPDEELLDAAEAGSLATEAGLDAQTERLLGDPRALEAFTQFLTQWWELGPLPTLEKDRTLFRAWSSDTPAAYAEELRLFVADVWSEGPTLERLLRAPFTYVDASLAGLYGLPLPSGEGFERVELEPTRASGILTLGALLATHAKSNQTSPVHRGKFVRSRLLCMPPEPPPPDIVVKPPSVDPRRSTRERFAQHSSDPRCAGCHSLMDPIGFGFERYDAVGRFRETDGDEPVDATGELIGTDVDGSFDGVGELAARLVASEDVRRCVATQWFRYAFGRGEQSESDRCMIDRLSYELAEEGGDFRAMMRATVRELSFRAAPPSEVDQ